MRIRSLSALLCFIALVTAGATSALAQTTTTSADPTLENPRLYAHHTADEDEYEGYMNSRLTDPNATDTEMGDGYSCGLPLDFFNDPINETWTLELDPSLDQPVFFDTSKTLKFNLYIGSPDGDGEDLNVSTTLKQGDVVIASAPGTLHSYTASDEERFALLTLNATVQQSMIQPQRNLTWTINAQGDPCTSDGVYLGVHNDTGPSHIELPIINETGRGTVHWNDLTGPTMTGNATGTDSNDTHYFNWTSGSTFGSLAYNATVSQGSLSYSLNDGNQTVQQGYVTSTSKQSHSFSGASPGSWQLVVYLFDFTGSFDFVVTPGTATGTSGNTTGNGTGTGNNTDNSTDNDTTTPTPDDTAGNPYGMDGTGGTTSDTGNATLGGERRGIPSPAFVVIVLGLAATAAIVRTRRKP